MAATSYAAAWTAIHSRTALHLHAVTRADSLTGAGNVPARTMRHKVAAENGNGAVLFGRLGLRTN